MTIPKDARIYVAGHRGLVGSALWRELQRQGHTHLLGQTREELNLLDPAAVQNFYQTEKPEYVLIAAAKVGGIHANDTQPVSFLYENLQIQNHLIYNAWTHGVKKLLFLASSCVYPKLAPQPVREDSLLTGYPEPTNEWYSVAKIAGIKLCQAFRRQYGCDFISAAPANLYGPNDNYDPMNSHVLPALLRRFHEAAARRDSEVVCWGSGSPLREFMSVDDAARACLFLLREYSDERLINVGGGSEVSIRELTEIVKETTGYAGAIRWDTSKPDGAPRKLLDGSRLLAMGWKPEISLREGVALAYADFKARFCGANQNSLAGA